MRHLALCSLAPMMIKSKWMTAPRHPYIHARHMEVSAPSPNTFGISVRAFNVMNKVETHDNETTLITCTITKKDEGNYNHSIHAINNAFVPVV